jgi:hypothetical protein
VSTLLLVVAVVAAVVVITTLQTRGDVVAAVMSEQHQRTLTGQDNAWATAGRSRSVRAQPYRGTPLWRRLVSLASIGALSVAGGVALALLIGGALALLAIAVQAMLS